MKRVLRIAGVLLLVAVVGGSAYLYIVHRRFVSAGGVAFTFRSQGVSIRLDRYLPTLPGRHPAIIALHGSGGAFDMSGLGKWLTSEGYAVYVPHYFERTGDIFVDRPKIEARFRTWMSAVDDAIAFVAAEPDVDPNRIGLLGYSLGGYLSLAVAGQQPNRIRCVVEYSGGMPSPLRAGITAMPPVLAFHGDSDTVVPVTEARALEELLKRLGTEQEIHIYPGEGHGLSEATYQDSSARMLRFLKSHLR